VQALAGYGSDRLVLQDLYRLRVNEWQLLARIQILRRLNGKHVRQGAYLGYRRIRNGAVPDSLHFLFSEVSEAHAGDLSVGVGFTRSLVLDHLEEAVDPVSWRL
jgi:hypothetical protein